MTVVYHQSLEKKLTCDFGRPIRRVHVLVQKNVLSCTYSMPVCKSFGEAQVSIYFHYNGLNHSIGKLYHLIMHWIINIVQFSRQIVKYMETDTAGCGKLTWGQEKKTPNQSKIINSFLVKLQWCLTSWNKTRSETTVLQPLFQALHV